MESIKKTCGTVLFQRDLTPRAQNASLDALSAFISSDAFHSPTAVTQIKTVVPALVLILAQSTVPLSSLKLKYQIHLAKMLTAIESQKIVYLLVSDGSPSSLKNMGKVKPALRDPRCKSTTQKKIIPSWLSRISDKSVK